MKALAVVELEGELIALQEMKTPALQQKWRELFKSEPPRKMRAGFLQRAIAYRLQELSYGGLKPQTKRELQRLALKLRQTRRSSSIPGVGVPSPAPRRVLSSGTRLLREWNGQTELVEVTEDGFIWKQKTFRTLSSVAVAITGTKWSGPKFFGLDIKPGGSNSTTRRGSATKPLELSA